MPTKTTLKIGTRRSKLAIAQAMEVKRMLLEAVPDWHEGLIELVGIQTTGDRIQNRSLAEIGGKALFTKEIEEQLLSGEIDMAVHSMKDMPDTLPEGLSIGAILRREDPRDALVSPIAVTIHDLPQGATVGTSAIRRELFIKRLRPDLNVVSLRGNVNTRLEKLARGEVDAAVLAFAGLKRLGIPQVVSSLFEPDEMLPAVAQGAIGVEYKTSNSFIRDVLSVINDEDSSIRIAAERAFLGAIGGSCSTGVAALAEWQDGNQLRLRCMFADEQTRMLNFTDASGTAEQAAEMGREAARQLRA